MTQDGPGGSGLGWVAARLSRPATETRRAVEAGCLVGLP
jgi:hypothetical protein